MPNQKGKKKKPIGRPTKYTKAMCLQAIELGRSRASKTEIAVDLGISLTNAFYAWQEKHPEFQEAVKEAEASPAQIAEAQRLTREWNPKK